MLSRWLTFVVWALVAAAATAWGLRLLARPEPVPAQAQVAAPRLAAGADMARLFGAPPPEPVAVVAQAAPPPAERARFQLVGVLAAQPSAARAQGVALIAVDGKQARAYRVGHRIDGEMALLEVRPRGVEIGVPKGASSISLELPALPPPATGIPGGSSATAAAPLALPPTAAPSVAAPVPGASVVPAPAAVPFPQAVVPQLAQPGAVVPGVVQQPGLVPGGGVPLPAQRLRSLRNSSGPGTTMTLPQGVPNAAELAGPDAHQGDSRQLR